jgi:UDP-N-acetylmuramate: L-alanyl-gamma-D-glutamyl-meso-diaminopimelate ligase
MYAVSQFSLQGSTSLLTIPSAGRVHFIGICGVAMGALAITLSNNGYRVTGSDKEFYPPMSDMLNESEIKVFDSYDSENLTDDIDLVVIGNSVPVSNAEVQAVIENKLQYTFFAKALGEVLLHGKKSIVVAGTHGKTTTTAIISYGLFKLGLDPSYFIGGQVPQLPSTLHLGAGMYGVTEGDEYDSVFYVKKPKFHFYKPDILVINALEFDHADIYSNLEAIEKEFEELLDNMPAGGVIIACTDFPAVQKLIDVKKEYLRSNDVKVITFGESDCDARITKVQNYSDGMRVIVNIGGQDIDDQQLIFSSALKGTMNARNVLASFLVARELNIKDIEWEASIKDFTGASRRMEERFNQDGVIVIEDFAHHPTAVKETISAVKSIYPEHQCWVAFEPRSNTSRRNIFQDEYGQSFKGADRLFIADITTRHTDADQKLLDLEKLKAAVAINGVLAEVYSDGKSIAKAIKELISNKKSSVVIIIMSNGSFDGLPSILSNL